MLLSFTLKTFVCVYSWCWTLRSECSAGVLVVTGAWVIQSRRTRWFPDWSNCLTFLDEAPLRFIQATSVPSLSVRWVRRFLSTVSFRYHQLDFLWLCTAVLVDVWSVLYLQEDCFSGEWQMFPESRPCTPKLCRICVAGRFAVWHAGECDHYFIIVLSVTVFCHLFGH